MATENSTQCLSPEEADHFRSNQMVPEERQRIVEHLAHCARCQDLIQGTECETQGLHGNESSEPSTRDEGVSQLVGPADPPRRPPPKLGQYELLELLGRGGMGVVYKGLHLRLKRVVAVKILPAAMFQSPRAVARFHREVEAAGALDHPNLIRATDANEAEGIHFLVMDYVEGQDVARVLKAHGILAIPDACEIARQAAQGLQAAHEVGLVHRDIKPSNLMVTPRGQVKVLDLGLALLQEAPDDLTPSRQHMGTPDYMAPEQAESAHDVDIRADIYSLGCTLYKLLTGRAPFAGPEYDSNVKKLLAHARDSIPSVTASRPEVPRELAKTLDRMLEKKPERRFGAPAEVAQALAAWCEGSNLPALLDPSGDAVELRAKSEFTLGHKSQTTAQEDGPGRKKAPSGYQSRWALGRWALGMLLAAAVIGTAAYYLRDTAEEAEPSPLALPSPKKDLPPQGTSPLPAPSGKKGPQPRPAPELIPVQLENESVKGAESEWHFDQKKWEAEGEWEVKIAATGSVMIKLASVAKPDYRFGIRVKRLVGDTNGKLGIFLGYRDFPGPKGETRKRYQGLILFRQTLPGGQEQLVLERVVRVARKGSSLGATSEAGKTILPPSMETDPFLEIQVVAGRLAEVRWNGKALSGLADPPAPLPFNSTILEGDCVGILGIYGHQSVSKFRNPVLSLGKE